MKTFFELKRYLDEKLVIVGGDKKYGQVIFLAGGAGSGKGFALSNFVNSGNYKIFDPDEMKKTILKWNEVKKKYPELLGKNLKNPADTEFVHTFIRDKLGWDQKALNYFLSANRSDKSTLPNIVFDRTFKDTREFEELVPKLINAGYKKENMHLVWVLTDYRVAIQQNTQRDRSVPITVLIQTHSGTAQTMKHFLLKNYPSNMINGDAFVILGGEANTWFFKPPADAPKTRQMFSGGKEMPKPRVVTKFDYVRVKNAGQPFHPPADIYNTVLTWILQNSPDQDAIKRYLNNQPTQ